MTRPENPYRKGFPKWSIMEGGLQGEFDGLPCWDDLTVVQIGEVLNIASSTALKYISEIRCETGYSVRYIDGRADRWNE